MQISDLGQPIMMRFTTLIMETAAREACKTLDLSRYRSLVVCMIASRSRRTLEIENKMFLMTLIRTHSLCRPSLRVGNNAWDRALSHLWRLHDGVRHVCGGQQGIASRFNGGRGALTAPLFPLEQQQLGSLPGVAGGGGGGSVRRGSGAGGRDGSHGGEGHGPGGGPGLGGVRWRSGGGGGVAADAGSEVLEPVQGGQGGSADGEGDHRCLRQALRGHPVRGWV
jgi:hypothetical protein